MRKQPVIRCGWIKSCALAFALGAVLSPATSFASGPCSQYDRFVGARGSMDFYFINGADMTEEQCWQAFLNNFMSHYLMAVNTLCADYDLYLGTPVQFYVVWSWNGVLRHMYGPYTCP